MKNYGPLKIYHHYIVGVIKTIIIKMVAHQIVGGEFFFCFIKTNIINYKIKKKIKKNCANK
jgi:hypothetical protein